MFDIVWINNKIREGNYYLSLHAEEERSNQNITITQVIEALEVGIIIETYDDVGCGESYLVGGFSRNGLLINMLCSEVNNKLFINSVYIPSTQNISKFISRN